MEWLCDAILVIMGMVIMGVIWFVNDNGKDSPYSRGFRDGYNIAKHEYQGSQMEEKEC